jgi:elongation factor Ts
MNYVAADVKKLRDETGATFADCKNALTEAVSWQEALKLLEAKRDKKAEKIGSADRETKQGGVFSYVHHDHRVGVMLELNCSTDFVARSDAFRELARELALQIAGIAPQYINFEDVPAETAEKVREVILEDPAIARVPADRRDDFINGKLKKHFGEHVLMMQPWVKDDAVVVGDLVRKVIAETGENVVLRRFSRFELGK